VNIEELFKKYTNEYLHFERVDNPLSTRPDLSAFLLLDKLLGYSNEDILSCAGHDEVFLSADVEELAKVASEEDIITLIRCGVRYSSEYDCLCMFV